MPLKSNAASGTKRKRSDGDHLKDADDDAPSAPRRSLSPSKSSSHKCLVSAVKAADVSTVPSLLAHGADANIVDPADTDGSHLLHIAAGMNNTAMVELLLRHGADVNATDSFDRIALMVTSSLDVAKLLLQHGVNVNQADKYRRTSLHRAVVRDNAAMVELLLTSGAQASAVASAGWTALMEATSPQVIELLLKSNSDVDVLNARNLQGDTPLILAAQTYNYQKMRMLIEHGCDVDAVGDKGVTALILSLSFGHIHVTRLLLEHGACPNIPAVNGGFTPLLVAVYHDNMELTSLLIDHGVDVNQADTEEGITPLIAAASENYVDVLKLLLNHGADLYASDDFGRTAFVHAVQCGSLAALECLLNDHFGSLTNAVAAATTKAPHATMLKTLLTHAAVNNYQHIVKFLLTLGVSADSIDERDGDTGLCCAAQEGHLRMVNFLLDHGATASLTDRSGTTPLLIATRERHVEVARALLEDEHEASMRCMAML